MRHLVVKGILESEKSYLHVIDQLVNEIFFLQNLSIVLKPSHLIDPEDVTTIFYKMDEFYTIHKTFVSELEAKVKNWSDDQQIAEAVKKLVGYSIVPERPFTKRRWQETINWRYKTDFHKNQLLCF
ncbi:hypothetical protein DPMN_100168 [Dreissena polymorpha]|uniref:DH domain-containing protein n=1 Tax=Dreissena polymorpha TaxID=45954 RepID=A0A9D4LFE6_DREPO|nr:hypothetical protein DPMN_100168 [Dreissena polymorpha]